MSIEDLRPLFTERTAAAVKPALDLRPVGPEPALRLDADTLGLLRDGLGAYDMEIRWMVHLDAAGTLRLWRSWTGFQIYEAVVAGESITGLLVEHDSDRYTSRPDREPRLFERVLTSSVRVLRDFRVGWTPYGSSPSAGPRPAPWPKE